MSTGRTVFIGLDYLGINTLFELKKRLAGIRFAGDIYLISGEDPAKNPYQFLAVPESLPGKHLGDMDLRNIFRRASFTGTDRNLFQEEEVCPLSGYDETDNSEQVVAAFQNAVGRLNPFKHQDNFVQSTGLDILYYPVAAVYLFDIKTYRQDKWQSLIDKMENIRNGIRFQGTYHSHAVIFGHRTETNKDLLQKAGEIFHNIYLFDEESELVLNEIDDRIDMAANFLHVVPQMNEHNFMEHFQNTEFGRYYSFGATHVDYPDKKIIAEAVKLNLGDPEFGFDSGKGERFFEYFVEDLREVEASEEHPFTLGGFEPKNSDIGVFTDNYLPATKDSVANRANELKDRSREWLENKTERIKEELKRDAFLHRIKTLTSEESYESVPIEKWHDNFTALEFLLQREILVAAEDRAEKLKSEFQSMWKEYVGELYSEAMQTVYHQSADTGDSDKREVCEHSGQLVWLLTQKIVADIRDNFLPKTTSDKKGKNESKYLSHSPVRRKNVEDAIAALPRSVSMLPRLMLFLVLMFFFWGDIHHGLIMETAGNNIFFPAWASGAIVCGIFFSVFYWFGYRKKISTLIELLKNYLRGCRETKEAQIDDIQKNLINDFLLNAACYVRSNYAPRANFFDLVVHGGKTEIEELAGQYSQFNINEHPLNPTEFFYVNRCWLYRLLQENLGKWSGRRNQGVLRKPIPDEDTDEFKDRVEYLAENFNDYQQVFKEPSVVDSEQNLSLWKTRLESLQEADDGAESLLNKIVSEVGAIFEQMQHNDPKWRDLYCRLAAIDFRMDTKLFSLMSGRSAPTFRMHQNDAMIQPVVYTASEQFFSSEQQKKISKTFDVNNMIFLCLEGPVSFKEITWSQENGQQ